MFPAGTSRPLPGRNMPPLLAHLQTLSSQTSIVLWNKSGRLQLLRYSILPGSRVHFEGSPFLHMALDLHATIPLKSMCVRLDLHATIPLKSVCFRLDLHATIPLKSMCQAGQWTAFMYQTTPASNLTDPAPQHSLRDFCQAKYLLYLFEFVYCCNSRPVFYWLPFCFVHAGSTPSRHS